MLSNFSLAVMLDQALDQDASISGRISASQRKQLLAYLTMIRKWNKVFNLTAIRQNEEMLSLHLLDCIWAVLAIERLMGVPKIVVDVGSGAGLPGVVMAILWPEAHIHCVDTVSKKAAFIHQVRAELVLLNLHGHHTKIEDFSLQTKPDLITCRAYATIAQFFETSHHLCDEHTYIAAMKAKMEVIERELKQASEPLLTHSFIHCHVEPLDIPKLTGERHIVMLGQQALPYLKFNQTHYPTRNQATVTKL
jgi:16S rRNA (guanine527-N7)-methyltransferase